eukprot:3567903-Rhodomonas_salina.4
MERAGTSTPLHGFHDPSGPFVARTDGRPSGSRSDAVLVLSELRGESKKRSRRAGLEEAEGSSHRSPERRQRVQKAPSCKRGGSDAEADPRGSSTRSEEEDELQEGSPASESARTLRAGGVV